MNHPNDFEVVWEPIAGTSQELALCSPCDVTLYHGTRGPGKTATQLFKFRMYVGLGYRHFWRGVIFDREFKNFADMIAQSKKFFLPFEDGAKFHESASDLKWVWPTGEQLLFRHAKKVSDYDNFHGHEYPFIGWNELTKHPTRELYDKIKSTNRSSFVPEKDTPKRKDSTGRDLKDREGNFIYDTEDGKPLPEIPLIEFNTTNPSGPGHNWVKKQFIDCAKNGEIVKKAFTVFDPRTQKEVTIEKTQVAIFGSYRENKYLSASYIAELNKMTASNKNLHDAWLLGSWDITAGGALDDLWDKDVHVVKRFKLPANWKIIDRAFDWGSSDPFSVGWWAEANGEEVILPNGNKFAPVKGSLIQIAEWYGSDDIGTNRGLKISADQIADGIIKIETELMTDNWVPVQPRPGPADNQINSTREIDVDTIAKKMQKKGILWETSDKSQGSRINGLQLLRDRLYAAIVHEGPAIYFMDNCLATIDTLPSLPRDEDNMEDVDTTAEDHAYDMVRYRVLKGNNRYIHNIKVKFAT